MACSFYENMYLKKCNRGACNSVIFKNTRSVKKVSGILFDISLSSPIEIASN